MGHEDISTTGNIYAHLMDRDRKATSDIMDGVLRNSVFVRKSVRTRWEPKGQAMLKDEKDNKKAPKSLDFKAFLWYARRDSNPQHSEPESDALSIELRARFPDAHIV